MTEPHATSASKKAMVILDHRFLVTPDDQVWAVTMFGPGFWARYLEVFTEVRVIARLRRVESAPESAVCVSGERVTFASIPDYVGALQYLKNRSSIARTIHQELQASGSVILRVPQTMPFCAARICLKERIPFALEVVSDPWDLFSPGAVKSPLRPWIRRRYDAELRRICQSASATSYVTERALQEKYPPGKGRFTQGVSDVEISEVASASRTPDSFRDKASLTCLFVGSLSQLYKAPDIMLRAIADARQNGADIRLRIIGDGKYREELEGLARECGISDAVDFLGQYSYGQAVFEEMDAADLFLIPSRQEGLPRALVEAMSRGLPAIGTSVGGMPELLDPECLVNPNDVEGLSSTISRFARDPDLLARQSARNLEKATSFLGENIQEERLAFYRHVSQL